MDEQCEDCNHTELEHADGGDQECLECDCGCFAVPDEADDGPDVYDQSLPGGDMYDDHNGVFPVKGDLGC